MREQRSNQISHKDEQKSWLRCHVNVDEEHYLVSQQCTLIIPANLTFGCLTIFVYRAVLYLLNCYTR